MHPASVFVLLLVALVAMVGLLVAAAVRDRRDGKQLPLLTDVGERTAGMLTCPVCQGASFQSPPLASRGFFALALGPFVFGSLSSARSRVAECVSCGTLYRQGVPVAVPALPVG